jgi:hypothetical protein
LIVVHLALVALRHHRVQLGERVAEMGAHAWKKSTMSRYGSGRKEVNRELLAFLRQSAPIGAGA